MSTLTSSQLLTGLHDLGTSSSTPSAYRSFTLHHASLSDISTLSQYKLLQQVDVSYNKLESIAGLAGCESLREMNVSHNLLERFLDFNGGKEEDEKSATSVPHALTHVNYSHNNLSSLLPPSQSKSLQPYQHQTLRTLDLSVNRLSSLQGLNQTILLSSLTHLNLSRNTLSSFEGEVWRECTSLTYLDLSGNMIQNCNLSDDENGESLGSGLIELRTLLLDSNEITSIRGLSILKKLNKLSLRGNKLSEIDEMRELAQTGELVELDLRENPISIQNDDESNVAGEDTHARLYLLYLLPTLLTLDTLAVTIPSLIASSNKFGQKDSEVKKAIQQEFLPRGEETKMKVGVKSVMLVEKKDVKEEEQKQPASSASTSVTSTSTSNGTILPESIYMSLLTERGFLQEWKGWIVKMKKYLSTPISAADGQQLLPDSLSLNGILLGDAGCWALSEVLKECRHVSRLDMEGCFGGGGSGGGVTSGSSRWSDRLSDRYGFKLLLRTLLLLPNLAHLRFSSCGLGKEEGMILGEYLNEAGKQAKMNGAGGSSLRTLWLGENKLGENVTGDGGGNQPQQQQHVVDQESDDGKEEDDFITKPAVSSTPITITSCPGLRSILSGLKEHMNLEVLDLSKNGVDRDGARRVAEWLGEGGTSTLAATVNVIQDESSQQHPEEEEKQQTNGDEFNDNGGESDETKINASSTVSSTSACPSIHTLLLSSNPLTDSGVSYISHSLRSNTRLTSLVLRGGADAESSLHPLGLKSLCKSISRYNRVLKKLDLSGNKWMMGGASGSDVAVEASSSTTSSTASALASLFYHSTNHTSHNEAGFLEEVCLANTGLMYHHLPPLAKALGKGRNQCLRVLDISNNPHLIDAVRENDDSGLSMLWNALQTHPEIETVRFGSSIGRSAQQPQLLGEESCLALSEFIKNGMKLKSVDCGIGGIEEDEVQQLKKAYGFESIPTCNPASDQLAASTKPPTTALSEDALSSLGSSLASTISKSQVNVIGLQNLGENLERGLLQAMMEQMDGSEQEQAAQGLSILDLSSNTWSSSSLRLLSSFLSHPKQQQTVHTLRLASSRFEQDVLDDPAVFEELISSLFGSGSSLTSLDLSYSNLNVNILEGIGRGILQILNVKQVQCTLMDLNLAECELDSFAVSSEDADLPSSFLQSLSHEALSLQTLNFSHNSFAPSDFTQLLSSLQNNWSLRTLKLHTELRRGNAELYSFLERMIHHAVLHGLQYVSLPYVKHSASDDETVDQVVKAVSDGWIQGVAAGVEMIQQQQQQQSDSSTTLNILHRLTIELGCSDSYATLTWKQKKKLIEALRPSSSSCTTITQVASGGGGERKDPHECFRMNAILAGGASIRMNAQQQMTCGVDLIENALSARLASQRL